MPLYRIRNLSKYQHYKNRRPPWVKLYRSILGDTNELDYPQLPDHAWRLGLELVLLASENGSDVIDCDPKRLTYILRRKVHMRSVQALERIGFIELASNMLATCTGLSKNLPQRSEIRDRDQNPPTPLTGGVYSVGFTRAWKTYPHVKGRSSKAEAFKRWRQMKLETETETVLTWIERFRKTPDWTKDSGAYVPGMHVWLRNHRDKLHGGHPNGSQSATRSPSS